MVWEFPSFFFVILGYWLYFEKAGQPEVNSTLVEIVGLATMIFFGFLIVLKLKKVTSDSSGK